MVGAITINTILTFGAILIVLVVGMILTYPEIAVVPIVAGCLAVAVVLPVLLFPFTHTIWAAIDLAMHPLEPAEVAEAITAVRGAGGLHGRRFAQGIAGRYLNEQAFEVTILLFEEAARRTDALTSWERPDPPARFGPATV